MTFLEFKRLVLQHLDQYSVAGEMIPLTYNNQADYTMRIAALANTALRTIATQAEMKMASFVPAAKEYEGCTELPNGMTKIEMPADFWTMTGRGLPTFEGDEYHRNMHYQWLTDREILVPTRELNKVVITYYRYPRKLLGTDKELLDCSEAAADCASFYVAAQLARHDSPYAYQTLYNEFEQMMVRLKKPVITETSDVEDVYGF